MTTSNTIDTKPAQKPVHSSILIEDSKHKYQQLINKVAQA